MIQLQWNALNRWRSQKMSYKQMLVSKKLWICYAHWAGIQEKWVTLSGVWKANGSTENWTVDIVWIIIVLETRFTQTTGWDEFLRWDVLLWVVVDVQTTPNSGKGFCRDAFLFVLSYSVLNHVELMAYFLILINWVRISSSVVGGVVGGAISHGPHFSKLKGQTSKPPNDNHHAWCVYCISKGRLSLLSSIMLLLSNESFVCQISEFPLFLFRFFVREEMSHYSRCTQKLSCWDKAFEMSKSWQVKYPDVFQVINSLC